MKFSEWIKEKPSVLFGLPIYSVVIFGFFRGLTIEKDIFIGFIEAIIYLVILYIIYLFKGRGDKPSDPER